MGLPDSRSALSLILLHGNKINFTRSLLLLPLKMTRMFLWAYSRLSRYSFCYPESDCPFGDGMTSFSFGDISNLDSGCSPNEDFTDQSTDLVAGDVYDMTFVTGYGSQVFRVWIDYNDDSFFSDELIVDNPILATVKLLELNGLPNTIPLSTFKEHLMRCQIGKAVPDDACEETQYGETEDYTVILWKV